MSQKYVHLINTISVTYSQIDPSNRTHPKAHRLDTNQTTSKATPSNRSKSTKEATRSHKAERRVTSTTSRRRSSTVSRDRILLISRARRWATISSHMERRIEGEEVPAREGAVSLPWPPFGEGVSGARRARNRPLHVPLGLNMMC